MDENGRRCGSDAEGVSLHTNERDDRGRFAPGHSGGPGRPRGQSLSAELRRQGDPETIARRLLDLIANPRTPAREVLKAIELYGDRTEGKAIARSWRITAAAQVLPANFFGLPASERDRVIDEIRQRALTGAIDPHVSPDEDPYAP